MDRPVLALVASGDPTGICTKCGQMGEFYGSKKSQSWCKECRKKDEARRRADPHFIAKH